MSGTSLTTCNLTRVATSAAITGAPCRVFRVEMYGTSDAASLKLYNAASATGTEVYGCVAPFTDADASAAASVAFDFTSVGGIDFSSKCYAAIAGTSSIAYVWWA